jgi:hypothetical protein
MNKKLLTKKEDNWFIKDIKLFEDPRKIKVIQNKLRWTILQKIAKEPRFAADIARELEIHEQKIYYHIRKLVSSGLVKVAFEKEVRGATAKCYTTTEQAFGLELSPEEIGTKLLGTLQTPTTVMNFFNEFNQNGKFDGLIVVGSPEAHGPHKTWARDGHYGIYIGMFIGSFLAPPSDLYVKLDVKIRAEKKLGENLLLVGGPAVNLVTQDINQKLAKPIFDNHIKGIAPDAMFGRGITSKKKGQYYAKNNVGAIFKVPNPYNNKKSVIAFAGQGRRGTKAAILALTNDTEKLLKGYENGSFRRVVEGFDLNGDGTIDSVEILE